MPTHPTTPYPGDHTDESPPTVTPGPGDECLDGRPVQIGGYEILELLGRGGIGVVYRARDRELKRIVALKLLSVGGKASEDELVRFRAEAEVLASLQHPNIVQVYDLGMHEGQPYLVLEYVDGGTLLDRIAGRPQPMREAAALVETLARAMQVSHDHGIIHRDLKPANVLLTRPQAGATMVGVEGAPVPEPPPSITRPMSIAKITDFGLARRLTEAQRLTRPGVVMGTPEYMAPEQAVGSETVGPAADIYSLGAILYELLTGRPPFRGVDWMETLEQVRTAEPASPSRLVATVSRDLSVICLKCLEKSPTRRYASALDLADDLRCWQEGRAIRARPTGMLEGAWRLVKRHPWRAALAGCTVVLIALALFAGWAEQRRRNDLALYRKEQEITRIEREKDQLLQSFLEKEQNRSLEALDGILELVTRGRLRHQPGLESLHQKLLDYYQKLVELQATNDLAPRDKLAAACFRLGQLMRTTGRKTDALKAVDKSLTLYRQLASAPGAKDEARHWLARAMLERGILYRDLGRRDQAEKDLRSALQTLEKLTCIQTTNLDFRRDLGEVMHNLGVLLGEDPTRLEEARKFYRQARKLREALCLHLSGNRADLRDLARTHGYMGDLELEMRQYARADHSYWESHRIREKLAAELSPDATKGAAKDTEQEEDRFQLARSWANFGRYQTRVSALDTAIDFYTKALKIQQELVKQNPARTEYQGDLTDTLARIAELVMLRPGASSETDRRHLNDAVDMNTELLKTNAEAISTLASQAECHALLARREADSVGGNKAYLDLAEKQLTALTLKRKRSEELYHLAAIHALRAEQLEAPARAQAATRALAELKAALEAGFRRLHPREIARDRAWKALKDRPEFKKLLASSGEKRWVGEKEKTARK